MFRKCKFKGDFGTSSYGKKPKVDPIDLLLGGHHVAPAARLNLPPHPVDPQPDSPHSPNQNVPDIFTEDDVEIEQDLPECLDEDEAQDTDQTLPFDRIRSDMSSFYTAYAADVHESVAALPAAEMKVLNETFIEDGKCKCPKAACRGACKPVGESAHEVYVLTMSACHLLKIPVMRCKACGEHFLPNPLQLGCLPGSVSAYRLKARGGTALWFHIGLLQQIDALQYHAKMVAMFSTAKALHEIWDELQPLESQAVEVGHGLLSNACPRQ